MKERDDDGEIPSGSGSRRHFARLAMDLDNTPTISEFIQSMSKTRATLHDFNVPISPTLTVATQRNDRPKLCEFI